ncbi:Sulfate transport system permease protein CysW [Thermotalea metallivorans]|uniref:Sulfate transport system permease protein CysW n=1 Tax=Thermotalea metallivorans TaxID=520762 RepID=A0A140LAK8_9FIRM|nr:ABC transporter permease [Thermotalea metallivorans]KXG77583.1 Sulfate transport system permease protein CysW [Thermotalea metallivorans]
MREILEGCKQAIILLLSFDQEVYSIIFLSLYVSLMATFFATLLAIPVGILLGIKDFQWKNIVIRFVYTLMSLPPVIAGLVVFLLISRKGPFGFLGLVYTPTAMIIAQTCLVIPIITGIVYNGTKEKGKTVQILAKTLGADSRHTLLLLMKELRIDILTGIVTGYGRAVSEVGAVMIVGGNIKGHTRVMTTTITMLQSMGNYEMAIALGMVLLGISFTVNTILYYYQRGE